MTSKTRIVKVRSWSELPQTLTPGTYHVGDVRVEIRERVPKEEVMMAISGIKHFADKYYS